MPHDSVRPHFADDVVVRLRARPDTLAAMREGIEVGYLRLDLLPGAPFEIYDVYVESPSDLGAQIGAVDATHAPHSPAFERRSLPGPVL